MSSKQWIQGQEADANHLFRMSIALTIQNTDIGAKTLLRISDPISPDYGRYLSARDIARMFEPEPSHVLKVMSWLGESGIGQDQVHLSHGGGHLFLTLSAREAILLLKTKFYHQTHQITGERQIACQYYYIPDSLAGSIDFIRAASLIPTHRQFPRQQVVLQHEADANMDTPEHCYKQTALSCLRDLYGIPRDMEPHPNNSLGIFCPAYYSWTKKDLDMFFDHFQPSIKYRRPKVDGINGGFRGEHLPGANWHREANLDFEYSMALTSPQEVTTIQVGSEKQMGNLDDMLAAFDRYYCDPVNPDYRKFPHYFPEGCNGTACDCGSSKPPKVISISWVWTEANFSTNYLQRQCLEFLKLGLMGTTVVAGVSDYGTTSDSGSYCIDNKSHNGTDGRFSPLFPATCPWITSVGGTQMLRPNGLQSMGAGSNETAFCKLINGYLASSGGGFSNVFPAPPYQVPNVAEYKKLDSDHLNKFRERFSDTGRGFPDVALRADDYIFVNDGKWGKISGSSASAPVFASIITLINSERMRAGKVSVGFVNPALYSSPHILNDVVNGSNRGCGVDEAFRAAPGWDAVTGLGSPDYERMRRFFVSLP